MPTLHTALHRLHTQYSLPHIVLTSIPLSDAVVRELQLPDPPVSYRILLPERAPASYHAVGQGTINNEGLVCFASSWTTEGMQTWAYGLPTIDVPFTGTGDLLSALCAAWFKRSDDKSVMPPLAQAVSKALLTVQQVLLKTHLYALSHPSSSTTDDRPTAQVLRQRELRIIPERALIADPGEGWSPKAIDWSAVSGA